MAKSPPAPAVPAPAADAAAAPDAAPSRLQRLRAALSRKVLIVGAGGVLSLSVVGAGAYMLWPSAEAPKPVKPAAAKKARAKASDAAARAASAASSAEPAQAAASSVDALRQAVAASQPAANEDPMDKLRRRLGETLGQGASLDAGGAGELRVSRRDAPSV
ncbi:MAG TPA: hypothetical protein VKI18_06585, partial [Albitalea sp.]|nr:hypothetical protein [Albitalea sp.]